LCKLFFYNYLIKKKRFATLY